MAPRVESQTALELLDWPDVLDTIAVEAASDAGRVHVRRLQPRWDMEAAERVLSCADEMLGLVVAFGLATLLAMTPRRANIVFH